MAFDVVMFGTLTLPERNVEEWLTTPVEPGELPWLEELDGVEVLQETPEAMLTCLEHVVTAPHELFEVSLTDGKLEVACYVREDTFRETSQALGLLFGSAAAFGGTGELHFSGYQGIRFAERVTVRGGRAQFARLTGETIAKVELNKQFQALDARIHERFDSLVGRQRPAGELDARGSRWSVNPFTGRRERVAADQSRLR
ncbi:MAG: hypothetical protein U0228_00585 [Myxococcaceae bacterium]